MFAALGEASGVGGARWQPYTARRVLDEVQERENGVTRGALRIKSARAFGEYRTSDVAVDPGHAAGEFTQE
jgi:hypothetical protein